MITGYIQKICRFVADECFCKWKLALILYLKYYAANIIRTCFLEKVFSVSFCFL